MRPYMAGGDLWALGSERTWFSQPVYVTQAELYIWAKNITETTEEGQPYHDAFSIFENTCKKIAAFFDGSLGTFVNPITGETTDFPEICTYIDIENYFISEFNARMIGVSHLYPSIIVYQNDNDAEWYRVLNKWAGRISRFCKFNSLKYTKLLKLSAIEYNPIADYWTKTVEVNGNAPYAGIVNDSNGDPTVNSWTASNGKETYETTSKADEHIKNEHFTTTYDDAANTRLESYDKQTGGTKQTNQIPNSAGFNRRKEEGNKGYSIQDIITKEYDIAKLWDIVDMFMNDMAKDLYLYVM